MRTLSCAVLLLSALLLVCGLASPAGFIAEAHPGVAAAFVALALSILLIDSSRRWLAIGARILAAGAAVAGAIALRGESDGISPVTAVNLVLTGGALLLLDRRLGKFLLWLPPLWGASALWFATLTGYAFDAAALKRLRFFAHVSLHTTIFFLLLSTAIMLLRPREGASALLLRSDPGGKAARRLLPAAVFLPFVASLAIVKLYQAGGYGSALMVLLFVVAPVVVFVPLVLYSSSLLSRMDRERSKSELDLRISRERFAGVVASAMDAIITLDEELNVVVFNQAAEKMFGCPAGEAVGRPVDRFIPAELRDRHSRDIRKFGETGVTARSMRSPGVLSALRANGEQFPIEATISHVRVAGQKLYTVILRDITERMQSEATLRQSWARFRSIYEQAAVGIEQLTLDGRWLMANAALCRMLGYEEHELLGRSTGEITHPEDYHRELELRSATRRERQSSFQIEKRYRHRNGSLVWVQAASSLVSDGSGEPMWWISVIQDLTARKSAEEQLSHAQKMEAIGRLAGGVAHDFNTLLNVMLGYSDLLFSELPEGDQRRERVEQIKSAADAGALLTKQLLAFSRKQVVAQETTDLRQIASAIVPILARLLRDDIEMSVHCSDEPCPVKADPGQIQQVVLNLVSNAADAMPEGGRLKIAVKPIEVDEAYRVQHPTVQMGNYALLSVSDSGMGMSPEVQAHIFEPFFTTKEAGKGTGLGLATVYAIIKRSGGDIWVYSEPGSGTVFKVFLPRDVAVCPPKPAPAPRVAVAAPTGATILLAEDSAALRELTKVILVREGYRVLDAEDGVAALELAEKFEGTIDLLLTDIMMPRMRGTRLAEELLRRRPGIAVVFLSGYAEEAVAPANLGVGFQLVEKPYVSNVLLEALRDALGNVKQNAAGH